MQTPAVEIADLRRIVNRLLDHIESNGKRSIALNQTFYWDVPEEDRYGIDDRPGNLDVRSLHDDWDCIRFLVEEGEEPIVDQLSEAATLLRYIGDSLREEID
ncbi:MAG: hypothetical protein JSU82_04245 [Rhodospirillales bacterium]|nr:MAG: hypothetical protein JSU82_04245 [Rhodospirillales bacterium]